MKASTRIRRSIAYLESTVETINYLIKIEKESEHREWNLRDARFKVQNAITLLKGVEVEKTEVLK
jgi:hypothetical protein